MRRDPSEASSPHGPVSPGCGARGGQGLSRRQPRRARTGRPPHAAHIDDSEAAPARRHAACPLARTSTCRVTASPLRHDERGGPAHGYRELFAPASRLQPGARLQTVCLCNAALGANVQELPRSERYAPCQREPEPSVLHTTYGRPSRLVTATESAVWRASGPGGDRSILRARSSGVVVTGSACPRRAAPVICLGRACGGRRPSGRRGSRAGRETSGGPPGSAGTWPTRAGQKSASPAVTRSF